MKRKYFLLMFVLGVCSNVLMAQSFDSIVSKAVKKYQHTENYRMEMKYTMYKDSITSAIKDNQQSVVIKAGNNCYFKMDTSEIIFTSDFNLKISLSEKLILYIDSPIANKNLAVHEQNMFLSFLDKFKNKTIKDMGGYWECILQNPKGAIHFTKIILHVSKKDDTVLKQIYYFNYSVEQKIDSSAENTQNERLEITQMNFQINPVYKPQLFKLGTYINKTAKSIEPSNQYKNFKIILH